MQEANFTRFEFPDGFRAAATLRGFNFGHGRQPQTQAQMADRARLTSTLECMLADFKLVPTPQSGCPAPRAAHSRADVESIVLNVLRELETRGIL